MWGWVVGEGEKRDQPTPTFLLTQTVPTSPELYRNSFTYYTTPASPPDLAACVHLAAICADVITHRACPRPRHVGHLARALRGGGVDGG